MFSPDANERRGIKAAANVIKAASKAGNKQAEERARQFHQQQANEAARARRAAADAAAWEREQARLDEIRRQAQRGFEINARIMNVHREREMFMAETRWRNQQALNGRVARYGPYPGGPRR